MQRTPGFRPPESSSRRSESKTPRNPARVFPLPVGEVRRIDSRFRTEGTQSNCAWVNAGKLAKNQSRKRGCRRAASDDSFLMRFGCVFPPLGHRNIEFGLTRRYIHFKIIEYGVSVLCFPSLDISLRVDVFARARLR